MDVRALNRTLAAWHYFVFLTRNGESDTPPIKMWLTSVEETSDGRLVLKTCDIHDPKNSLEVGQVEVGEDVFVTIRESLSGNRTFSLRDAGWTVSNFNLPLQDSRA
jgi:hypothetical protein